MRDGLRFQEIIQSHRLNSWNKIRKIAVDQTQRDFSTRNFRDKLVPRMQIGICPRYISLTAHILLKVAVSFLTIRMQINGIFLR